MPGHIEIISIDATGYTGISGVYAAGDAASPVQQVGMAASSGLMAAATINRDLLQEDLEDGQAA